MPTYFGGQPSTPQLRLSRPNDVNKLTNLDLKCYQYPMDFADWQDFLKHINDTCKVVILELGTESLGFAAWELVEEKEEDGKGDSFVQITRLGVRPEQRRKGHGKALLEAVETSAKKLGADRTVILVPEIHCCPGDPDDVSVFLNKCVYKPTGVIEYSYTRMYGDLLDGYYFAKELT